MTMHRAGLLLLWGIPWLSLPLARGQEANPPPRRGAPSVKGRALEAWALSKRRRSPVVEVVERIKGAVVNIHSERTARGPATEELFALAPSQNRVNGMGTGILIDQRGYIVTNQHVVEDVNVIRVRLHDRSSHTALVVARDRESDLALLKIDTDRPLPTMPLGTSSDIMVGETVVAIGNAYGYEHTVSVGVVSAVKRDVNLNKELSYKDLVQTDASINPGNSGGPLANINGELIGVNVAIRAGAQGIGFAIPVDTMIRVVADMMSTRKRTGTWHGLCYRDQVVATTPSLARCVMLDGVEANGPAAEAGLRRGDVLVKVGDVPVACSIDVERALLDKTVGESVPVIVKRGGAAKQFDLVLQSAQKASPPAAELVWRKLGLRFQPVSGDKVVQVNGQLHGGLEVLAVNNGGIAGQAGIQRGDIMVGLHHWETLTLDNVSFVLKHQDLANFNPLCFYIIRSGQVRRGWFQQVD
jgi:serine protease Do